MLSSILIAWNDAVYEDGWQRLREPGHPRFLLSTGGIDLPAETKHPVQCNFSDMRYTAGGPILAVACAFLSSGTVRPAQTSAPAADTIPSYVVEALTPFRGPPSYEEVAELVARWRADGGLIDAHDRIVSARLWRRAGEPDEALVLLGTLPEDGPLAPLARYERARVRFELGDEFEALRRAPADWRAACRSLSDLPTAEAENLRHEFWEDLGMIATPEEHETWPDVPDDQACEWIGELIAERAFRMAITPDERLAVHYQRLVDVRESYWLRGPRFYVSMSDYHGRRKNEWMDDRGLVYLRMGPPSFAESCGGVSRFGEDPLDFQEDPLDADKFGHCWVYERPDGYKLYYFSTRNRVTGRTSPNADFRLQESLGPRADPRDPYFQRYIRNSDLPRSVIFQIMRGGGVGSADEFDAGLDLAESRHYRQLAKFETRRLADEALVAIPDVPAVTGADMLWESLRFLNPFDGRWQVWVVATMPAGQLESVDRFETWIYEARGWLASRHPDGVRLDSMFNRATVDHKLAPDAGIPLRATFLADEGMVPITLAVYDPFQQGFGAWVQDTIVIPAVLPLPTVSDIAVAQTEGGDWTRDGATFLRVSPDHVTGEDGRIHIYFETYGIRRSGEYDVEIRLARDKKPNRIFKLDPGDVPFRLEFSSRMPNSRIGTHALRLDLADTDPGEYDLAIRILDRATGTHSLPSVTPIRVRR